jgi:eukaryotic-like serine/threonine-protein kinase
MAAVQARPIRDRFGEAPSHRMPRDFLPVVRDALAERFTVDREIGRGGAAVVFLAHSPDGTPVALKVLRPELAVTVAADRFLREIRALGKLDHPNIARLLDAGEREWLVYFTMPYVEGVSLKRQLERTRRLGLEDALRVGRDLLSALDHAHAEGIVHRDVKPDNILLSPAGCVLLDFGIARAIAVSSSDRLTRSGITVGTSAYMSPEQITGSSEPDPRSDIYAAGCVLFECLAGRPPFMHRSEGVVLHMHLNEAPPDLRQLQPGMPAACAATVARALAKKPEDRWPTARAMLHALTAEE